MMTKSLVGIAVLLSICISQIACNVTPRNSTVDPYAPRNYTINLDLPPKQRWAELIPDYKHNIQVFRDYMLNLLGVNPFYLNFIPFSFARSYDSEFAEEIKAIAELAGISYNEGYVMNFVYEFTAIKACTSIVMRTEGGRIIHGRNLDFGFGEYLANLSSVVTFHKNGKPLYQANVIAGYAGHASGLKFGKFGITMNERDTASMWDNLGSYFLHRSSPSAYLIRKVLEKADNFDEAVKMLSETRLIAPTYFIVSGTQPHEGVVITRGANEVRNMSWLSENDPDWFIVHTNYDRDQPDAPNDLRRVPAEQRLAATQHKNVSEQTLMDVVFSKHPTLNIRTILTAIFSAETNYYNTTMWY